MRPAFCRLCNRIRCDKLELMWTAASSITFTRLGGFGDGSLGSISEHKCNPKCDRNCNHNCNRTVTIIVSVNLSLTVTDKTICPISCGSRTLTLKALIVTSNPYPKRTLTLLAIRSHSSYESIRPTQRSTVKVLGSRAADGVGVKCLHKSELAWTHTYF